MGPNDFISRQPVDYRIGSRHRRFVVRRDPEPPDSDRCRDDMRRFRSVVMGRGGMMPFANDFAGTVGLGTRLEERHDAYRS